MVASPSSSDTTRLDGAGAAVAVGECVPIGILQILYADRTGEELMQTFSLAMSWCAIGAKLSQLAMLADFLPYRSKQAKKVTELEEALAKAKRKIAALAVSERAAQAALKQGYLRSAGHDAEVSADLPCARCAAVRAQPPRAPPGEPDATRWRRLRARAAWRCQPAAAVAFSVTARPARRRLPQPARPGGNAPPTGRMNALISAR